VEEAVSAARTPRHAAAPDAIHAALRAIWRDCCAEQDAGSVSRALTHNFVGIATDERADELRAAVDRVAGRLPCRAFVVALARDGTGISAEVFGAARTHGSSRDLVLEQIELRTPQSAFGDLAGVVRPLLVNDLPTHFYWSLDWPAAPREFDSLMAMAEHTIVDSARFSAPLPQLDAVELRARQGRRLTDLAWLRLRPWRRALAEGFERCDYAPEQPTRVAIRHDRAAAAAAAVLGRWLERRLDAEVSLVALDHGHAVLQEVEIRHDDAVIRAALRSPERIEVEVTTAAACFVPVAVPASRGSEGDLLAAAIALA
jgi:glucose-6-phosphate dehydrogenase assembly protein OpcA